MRKRKETLIVMMAAAFMLAGCGSADFPERDMLCVEEDGTLGHTIVDAFDPDVYYAQELEAMAQELEAMAQQKIERYSDGAENIICESVETSGNNIIVKMHYQTDEDYVNYNNRELFCGTVGQAIEAGYSLKDLVGADGNVISDEELSAIRENHIVIVQVKDGETLDVNVYENIIYASANITLSGRKDAIIAAQEKEDVLSYIVF